MDQDLHDIAAAFYTEHLVVHATVSSSEFRLSDHLNSSLPTVDIHPTSVSRSSTGGQLNLEGTSGPLTKAHVLFVVPMNEPVRGDSNSVTGWQETWPHRCWMALGACTIVGNVHSDVVEDSRVVVRSLDKPFFPITDAIVTLANGDRRHHEVVIVNRQTVDLLVVDDDSTKPRRRTVLSR
ncbi:MAG: hypothetical protein PVSMB7_14380 [Chloroflexota bacterium]